LALGKENKTDGINSTALGRDNKVSGERGLAVGEGNETKGKYGVTVGRNNKVTGKNSLAMGTGNRVEGSSNTVVGYKNKVTGNNSGAFGDPNTVNGNGSYVYGNDNTVNGNGSHAIGNRNKVNGNNNFAFGNDTNFKAGVSNSVALGNNSTVSSSNEVSVGSATVKRRITNVGDGEYSATSTDAVNGKQLYGAIKGVEGQINNVKSEVAHVGSLSAALAGLHPMQYDPKAPTQVMAALGHYKNKQSVAVGLGYYFNDRFMMTAGVAIGSEKRMKSMANVGFTLKLGKGSGVTEEDSTPIQNEVKKLNIENKELRSKLEAQDEKIKRLEEKLDKISNK
ncbi:YadA-like family protein, partial [Fusobacterium watanabei]|uniref:YadA-like family protein n=2 Tax=Fusobacterium TaxID=848 RepID=UPI003B586DE8